jgi:hypothetical protein
LLPDTQPTAHLGETVGVQDHLAVLLAQVRGNLRAGGSEQAARMLVSTP